MKATAKIVPSPQTVKLSTFLLLKMRGVKAGGVAGRGANGRGGRWEPGAGGRKPTPRKLGELASVHASEPPFPTCKSDTLVINSRSSLESLPEVRRRVRQSRSMSLRLLCLLIYRGALREGIPHVGNPVQGRLSSGGWRGLNAPGPPGSAPSAVRS